MRDTYIRTCSICACNLYEDEGVVHGCIGILPVQFCPTCYSGIVNMVDKLEDKNDLDKP